MLKPAFLAALLAIGLAAPLSAATLCDATAALRLAALDSREGIYVGEWRDKSGLRACMALAIERVHPNDTVTAVYFFGPAPAWSIAKPGFRRETYKIKDYDTLVLENLTNKYEFKLAGGNIAATYKDANGVITEGKLQKRY